MSHNNDLISRSALLEYFGGKTDACPYDSIEQNVWQSAFEAVQDEPAIDAVEVVRCKDCKFSSPAYINPEIFKRCSLFCKTVNADFFCGHGEKMDAEVEGC